MNWPVKKKLYAAFGAVIALVAVLAIAVYVRMLDTEHLAEEQHRYQEIARRAQGMYTLLMQMRRHEKDFLMRDGATTYEDQHRQRRDEMDENVASVRGLLQSNDAAALTKLQSLVTAYGKYAELFGHLTTAFKRRGNYDSGLQGEFREAAHELETALENVPSMTLVLLQTRRAEKDYLLRGRPEYIDKVHAFVTEAKKLAAADRQLGVGSSHVTSLLDAYRSKFDATVAAMADEATIRSEIHDVTEGYEVELDAFVHASLERANATEATAEDLRRSTERMLAIGFLVTFALALLIARFISRQVTTSVSALAEGTRGLGAGDLRVRVKVEAKDELGELGDSFNQMAGSLRDMTSNISIATTSMEDVVRELQATVAEQGAALQQQASSVSETVATVGELSRSADQVSDVARRVLDEADRSVDTSKRGLDAIHQSVQGMNDVREQVQNIATTILDLSDRTQQIGTIISTVDDFAERSSLLALNASIEAARAGEAGKAFSVVAGEVKNLAEQSRQATDKVRAILSDIQRTTHSAVMVTEEGSKRVDRGVELVSDAGNIIGTLAGAITASADSAKQIAAAARQQSNGIEQISVAMAGIEQFSKQNVQATRQTETTAQALAAVSKQLRSTTTQYQV